VLLCLGVLVVVQLRAQTASASLAALSAQELTVLIANVNTRNDQLRTEIGSLESELRRLSSAQEQGVTALDQIRADLTRVRAWTGLAAVTGPGVRIEIDGPIDGSAVQDLVNELWNGGADAIGIAGVRVVPGTVVGGPAGGLSVEDTPIGDPFTIVAIGEPEGLTGSLTRFGGIVAQIGAQLPDVVVDVRPVDSLDLPATTRSLIPAHGRPRL
jgi:uncharacterized protein YlxW (UPF0749 family)